MYHVGRAYAKQDEYVTPYYAVVPLVGHLNRAMRVWCPADTEDSQIVKCLRDKGFQVHATDIKTGQDFFNYTPDFEFDIIVTNPPYSLKNEWIERCGQLGKPFALLLPVTTLCSKKRLVLFERYGAPDIILFDRRIGFSGKERCHFYADWFMWPYFSSKGSSTITYVHLEKPERSRGGGRRKGSGRRSKQIDIMDLLEGK